MATRTVQPERIQSLNDPSPRPDGRYVLYWMQQSQRTEYNHALELAIQHANTHECPVVVGFGITADYPEANLRHYRFLLEGLRETAHALSRRNIPFVLRRGDPADVCCELAEGAVLVVCDRGYLKHQRKWRTRVAQRISCPLIQVETDVVVPVEAASGKQEYAARTLRPKINRLRSRYLVPFKTTPVRFPYKSSPWISELTDDIGELLHAMDLDRSVPPTAFLKGGPQQARRHLKRFLTNHFPSYAAHRNQPQTDDVSYMSPYLHFGQISPLHIGLAVLEAPNAHRELIEIFLEELIVRRELACNFAFFSPNYDQYAGLPDWARQTLDEHKDDPRPARYSLSQLEAARTHDPYWNAATREMIHTGYMHNHMRMYWGKKILEWSTSPQKGFRNLLTLNNKYFLDGRDPSSFANVGWVFGLHDRPWAEQPVFGKVRTMTASGLERKCDIQAYVQKVNERITALARRGEQVMHPPRTPTP